MGVLSADDPAEIQSLTDTLWVVLDPEEPYTDAYGEPYEAGEYGSTSTRWSASASSVALSTQRAPIGASCSAGSRLLL